MRLEVMMRPLNWSQSCQCVSDPFSKSNPICRSHVKDRQPYLTPCWRLNRQWTTSSQWTKQLKPNDCGAREKMSRTVYAKIRMTLAELIAQKSTPVNSMTQKWSPEFSLFELIHYDKSMNPASSSLSQRRCPWHDRIRKKMRLINTCNSIWGAFAGILREIETKCFCDPQSDCRLLSLTRKVLCQSDACHSVECRVSDYCDQCCDSETNQFGKRAYIGHSSDVFIHIHSPVFSWHSKLYSKNAVTIPSLSLSSLRSGIRTRFRTRKKLHVFSVSIALFRIKTREDWILRSPVCIQYASLR